MSRRKKKTNEKVLWIVMGLGLLGAFFLFSVSF